jgi:hypothetical protein
MACELLQMLDRTDGRCNVTAYHETPSEYVLRLRVPVGIGVAAADGPRLEVRLPKRGDSATVEHLVVP